MKARRLRKLTTGIGTLFIEPGAPVETRQAQQTVKLCFDGGCTLAGHGYGSYAFWMGTEMVDRVRHEIGDSCTANVAEWETLRMGLERVATDYNPAVTRVEVRGDSRLVVEGAAKRWKVKAPHLRPIAARVWELLSLFSSSELKWWPRENSVRIFGH